MKNTSPDQLKNILLQSKTALIVSHIRPDGDTIGSALALREVLIKNGVKVTLVCDGIIPEKFGFLAETALYKKVEEITETAGVCIFVDCASDGQMGESYKFLYKNQVTVNIDHHISNKGYGKYNYIQNKGSCCEVLYGLINELGQEIDQKIANFLLLGMVTDTGNFAHNNTTSSTLKIAGELMDKGADLYGINLKMFKSQSKNRSQLYLKVLGGIKFYHDDRVAIIKIHKSDLEELGLEQSATEGFIDYPLTISNVEIAVSVMETKDKNFKVSFRSKGKADVNQVASTFGGGGHVCASGAMLRGFEEDVIDKLVYTCGLYLD